MKTKKEEEQQGGEAAKPPVEEQKPISATQRNPVTGELEIIGGEQINVDSTAQS